MSKLERILIANRGEIAVRVLRTARALGYQTIAVYSDADASAPHVRLADDAVRIGPAPVAESYLDPDRILRAARDTRADAIHPGYGFLSENADFARRCESEGIVFIGPTADAIDLMGNKAAAKREMIRAGVPCVPGYEEPEQADEVLIKAAAEIGFPVMVKAAAGGGGRGMRLVEAESALVGALASARAESAGAFGSDELILENAILRPRHVEVQVFADAHGNVIHLAERDCSVQRRHQKVIEESPCPVMTPDLRARMGAAAVEAARSIGYRGAGTVEFLLDEAGAFYFLEMNTRLQVEHPVTEEVTGLDLVELQLRVAEGEPLGLAQEEVEISGHAIEVRLYAEDPSNEFLPSTGSISLWRPAEGDGLRVDAGIASGLEVSPFYDPMVAKLIAWGPDREAARRRLLRGLEQTAFFGPRSNQAFLRDCLEHDVFIAGQATTAFIDEAFGDDLAGSPQPDDRQIAIAATLQFIEAQGRSRDASLGVSPRLANWSSSGRLATPLRYRFGDADVDVIVRATDPERFEVQIGERAFSTADVASDGPDVQLQLDGRPVRAVARHQAGGRLHLSFRGRTELFENRLGHSELAASEGGGGRVVAPMHGVVVEVRVRPGESVQAGTCLCTLEAMKMLHEVVAGIDGIVAEVHAVVGVQVAADELLIEIEAVDSPPELSEPSEKGSESGSGSRSNADSDLK